MSDVEEGLTFSSAGTMTAKQRHSHDVQWPPGIPRAAFSLQQRDDQ